MTSPLSNGVYNFGSGQRADTLMALSRLMGPELGQVRDIAAAAFRLAELDHSDAANRDYYQLMGDILTAVALRLEGCEGDQMISELAAVIATEFSFEGDRETYDDMQNADLFRVLTRRRGLPVALGIIYIQAARAAGLVASGVAFPAHFLIRIDTGPQHFLVDPFDKGRILGAPELRAILKRHLGPDAELSPEYYAPVADRDVLMRLQNNILTRALQDEDFHRAQDILERMIAMAPENAGLYREMGAILLRTGDLHRALDSFQIYYDRATDPDAKEKAASLVARLQKMLQGKDRPH